MESIGDLSGKRVENLDSLSPCSDLALKKLNQNICQFLEDRVGLLGVSENPFLDLCK